ncbi:MAG: FtsW/RodA/SpoVE family cell cycle protein [Microgenomates group bacterium]
MEILIATFFLSIFGLFNLFGINQQLFFRQLIYILFGFVIYFFIKKIGRIFFQNNIRLFYYFFIFALIITYIIAIEIRGSKRWLDFYFFRFQASEIFKPFFILFLSEYLYKFDIVFDSLGLLLKSFIYFFIPFFIVFKQPDLANALTFLVIYFSILFFSKIPKKQIFFFFSSFMVFIPFSWFFLKDYQKARILSFLNPHLDTQGTAYNISQAIITIGSGMFFGKGLGFGTQSRLAFLPENTTDFAFASLVEQFGFFGGSFVILFYGWLIYILIKKSFKYFFSHSEDEQKKFMYTFGVLIYICFQVFVNIGMNMGILPVAGVALPFISYGGSAIMAMMIALALLP